MIEGPSASRIADDLWKLVCVPSPTRREREAALLYAEMLSDCGAEVELDETIHDSPSVIGRLAGSRHGPTLQLAGHIDHIDVTHERPTRTADVITGRGSADMKAGLACILEIVRVLATRRDFPGTVLVTVYGLHEAPLGRAEALVGLIERGIKGDAAVIFEGPPGVAVVCGKGQSIWDLALQHGGAAEHELRRPVESDQLIDAVLKIAQSIRAENRRLSTTSYDLLGPESLFIGQIHYGDFYNRAPRSCTMQGTRRWHPGRTFHDAQVHLADLLARAALPAALKASVSWTFVGESFAVDPNEKILRALLAAARSLHGSELPLGGVSAVMDTSRLVPLGRVPTVPVDCDGSTGHADAEFVRLPVVMDACRLALETSLNYLDSGSKGGA